MNLPDAPGADGPPDPVERVITLEVKMTINVGDDEDSAQIDAVRDVERALKAARLDADVECTGMEEA